MAPKALGRWRGALLDRDAEDMRQVQAGCLERFTQIVERHQSALFRYARSKLGSRPLAEDAVQETFMAAFQSRHSYDPHRGFRGWLWTILTNHCKRQGKSRWRRAEPLTFEPARYDSRAGGDELERVEERQQLEAILATLPVDQADAIRLRFFGELTFEEIGETLGCASETAKSRVRYGLEKMAATLRRGQEMPR